MLNGTITLRQCNECCNWSFDTKPECTVNQEVKNLQENDRQNKDYLTEYTSKDSLVGGIDSAAIEPLTDSCQCVEEHLGPQKLTTDFILQCV